MDKIISDHGLPNIENEGYEAKYYYGQSKFDVPYPIDTKEYTAWMMGYDKAKLKLISTKYQSDLK